MTSPDRAPTTWHIDAATLRAYADGTAPPPAAWSADTHLTGCAHCRELLGRVLDEPDRALLSTLREQARSRLETRPAPGGTRQPLLVAARGLLGPAWAWALLVLGALAVLASAARLPAPGGDVGVWLVALSPLVPVASVAAVYAAADRDATVVATPRGGLELVLLRTAAVLAVSLPVVTVAQLTSGSASAAWLLPGLALSAGSVAWGSWVGVERAALALTAVWAGLAGAALVAQVRGPAPVWTEPLLEPRDSLWLWAVLLLAAVAALVVRRGSFDTPGRVL